MTLRVDPTQWKSASPDLESLSSPGQVRGPPLALPVRRDSRVQTPRYKPGRDPVPSRQTELRFDPRPGGNPASASEPDPQAPFSDRLLQVDIRVGARAGNVSAGTAGKAAAPCDVRQVLVHCEILA